MDLQEVESNLSMLLVRVVSIQEYSNFYSELEAL